MTNAAAEPSKTASETARDPRPKAMADMLSSALHQHFDRNARALMGASSIARKNANAALAAGNAATRGAQAIVEQTAGHSAKLVENLVEGVQLVVASRNADDLIDTQQSFFRSYADAMTATFFAVGETFAKTTREVIAPWSGPALAVVEQYQKAAPRGN